MRVRVRRISEEMQKDEPLMSALRRVGALPVPWSVSWPAREGVLLGAAGETAEVLPEAAEHIFVRRSMRARGAALHRGHAGRPVDAR